MKPMDAGVSGDSLEISAPAAHRLSDFVALTKPRLNSLVVVTAGIGYYLGAGANLHIQSLIAAVIGVALVAAGAAGLNQVYERDTDGLMFRTRMRPIAAHRLTAHDALLFSAIVAVIGLWILVVQTNAEAAFLAFLTLVSYKQIPHFMAIAWLYRADFSRAGFPLLPVVEPSGRRTGRQAVLFSLVLVPLSLTPYFLHMSGPAYAIGAVAGSVGLLWLAVSFALRRTDERARALFLGSITYLPLLWGMLILDRL
jgi:heme o synthase